MCSLAQIQKSTTEVGGSLDEKQTHKPHLWQDKVNRQ